VKAWRLSSRVNRLSEELADAVKTETRLDLSSFNEPERRLLDRVQEIVDRYAPALPPQDVLEKNAGLWCKGLEIFGRRVMELFVDVVPDTLLCDELEKWYFKLYCYNFLQDWREKVQELRRMPKERYDALLCEYREAGLLDRVFRFPKNKFESANEQDAEGCGEQ
jgi:hypothetical protein